MRWYYGWNVVAATIVFQALVFGTGIYCFTFWVAYWTTDFDVGRSDVMLVFIGLQIGLGAFAPFAGRAIDRHSARLLISVGAVCFSLALVLATFATALWQIWVLFFTLAVAGLLLAGPLASQTLTARWFDRRRGLALGISTTGTSVGGFVMPIIMTALQAEYGWRDANTMVAVLIVVAVVPAAWLLIKDSPAAAGMPGEGAKDAAADLPPPLEHPETVAGILKRRVFWGIVLSFTPIAVAFGGAQQNLAPYTADYGISAVDTSYLVSVMAFVMVISKLFFGSMADRWDHRVLLWLMCVALGVAFALMLTGVSYPRLLVVSALLGVSAGGFLPLIAAVVSQRFGISSFGLVMGMVGPFTAVAAVGPWLAGYVRDNYGSYEGAWEIFALLLIPAALAALLLKERTTSATIGVSDTSRQ